MVQSIIVKMAKQVLVGMFGGLTTSALERGMPSKSSRELIGEIRGNSTGIDQVPAADTPVSELISPDQFTPIFEQLGTTFTESITEALAPLKDALAAITPCLCKEGSAEGGPSLALPAP